LWNRSTTIRNKISKGFLAPRQISWEKSAMLKICGTEAFFLTWRSVEPIPVSGGVLAQSAPDRSNTGDLWNRNAKSLPVEQKFPFDGK